MPFSFDRVSGAEENRRAPGPPHLIWRPPARVHLRLEIGQPIHIVSRTFDTVARYQRGKTFFHCGLERPEHLCLFGDGAGAAVLQNRGRITTACSRRLGCRWTKSQFNPHAWRGSRRPATTKPSRRGSTTCAWKARKPSNAPCRRCSLAARECLRRCEIEIGQNQVRHPASGQPPIIDAVGERLVRPAGPTVHQHREYGNTSAASVAIALDEACLGRIQRGDLISAVVFGAGLPWGAAVIEW